MHAQGHGRVIIQHRPCLRTATIRQLQALYDESPGRMHLVENTTSMRRSRAWRRGWSGAHARRARALLQRDDLPEELLLIVSGELSVTLDAADGRVRAGTLSAGMLLGELALLTDERRSGDVRADTDVEAFALSRAQLTALRDEDPTLQAIMLENLVRIVSRRAQAMRDEFALAVE